MIPWSQISMENLQPQEVSFYKNKNICAKTCTQPYSNWKTSHQGNQIVTFYIKEELFLEEKRRMTAKPNSNFLNFF